jgi:hypothetical protein
MRYVKSDPASMDVHISSPAPVSVRLGYHKILGWVKRNAPAATSLGRGSAFAPAGKMIGKHPGDH